MTEKKQFAQVYVRKKFRDGTESEPLEIFHTHYRARKFVARRLSEAPGPRDFEWIIQTALQTASQESSA